MADVMEAIIGGLYLDQGYRACQEFIKIHVLVHLPNILKEKSYLDPKSVFQEIAQEKLGITPSYKVLSETGPDHKKHFVVGVPLATQLCKSYMINGQYTVVAAYKKGEIIGF